MRKCQGIGSSEANKGNIHRIQRTSSFDLRAISAYKSNVPRIRGSSKAWGRSKSAGYRIGGIQLGKSPRARKGSGTGDAWQRESTCRHRVNRRAGEAVTGRCSGVAEQIAKIHGLKFFRARDGQREGEEANSTFITIRPSIGGVGMNTRKQQQQHFVQRALWTRVILFVLVVGAVCYVGASLCDAKESGADMAGLMGAPKDVSNAENSVEMDDMGRFAVDQYNTKEVCCALVLPINLATRFVAGPLMSAQHPLTTRSCSILRAVSIPGSAV